MRIDHRTDLDLACLVLDRGSALGYADDDLRRDYAFEVAARWMLHEAYELWCEMVVVDGVAHDGIDKDVIHEISVRMEYYLPDDISLSVFEEALETLSDWEDVVR